MLGVVEIEIHQHREDNDHDDVDKILLTEYGREPALVTGDVDDTDRVRLLLVPDIDHEMGALHGDVVHHQGKQCLIGAVFNPEDCRDKTPQGTGSKAGDNLIKQKDMV